MNALQLIGLCGATSKRNNVPIFKYIIDGQQKLTANKENPSDKPYLFIAQNKIPGFMHLERLINKKTGRYEYTTSTRVKKSLIANFGFQLDEKIGYILTPEIYLLNTFAATKFKTGKLPPILDKSMSKYFNSGFLNLTPLFRKFNMQTEKVEFLLENEEEDNSDQAAFCGTLNIYPIDPGRDFCKIWCGYFGFQKFEEDFIIDYYPAKETDRRFPLPLKNEWNRNPGKSGMVHYQVIEMNDLTPGTTYIVEVTKPGYDSVMARCYVEIPPNSLPGIEEVPYTILLGSCYEYRGDNGGFRDCLESINAYPYLRPSMKFLTGDQVYLDLPVNKWLVNPGEKRLQEELTEVYQTTWGKNHLGDVLASGANVLISDDHEYYNNYPDHPKYYFLMNVKSFRDKWLKFARSLYLGIQRGWSPDKIANYQFDEARQFNIGDDLSFLIFDTRIDRDHDSERFIHPENIELLKRWISGLKSPGVLVLGQPIIGDKKSIELQLNDYSQYPEFIDILGSSDHDIVILAGDVHYGRVSKIKGRTGVLKSDILEVIASPISLIFTSRIERAIGSGFWDFTGLRKQELVGKEGYEIDFMATVGSDKGLSKYTKDHFMTLSFSKTENDKVQLIINAWLVHETSLNGLPKLDFQISQLLT